MGTKRVTLATIAERLGVSASTVSNAYNRPDQLGAQLRNKVLATAAELGYPGPDPAASALRRGRVGALGLVQKSMTAAFGDPAHQLLMAGVAEACDDASLALVVVSGAAPDDGPDVLRWALVDGLIVHCDALDDDRRQLVIDRDLPIVTLDGRAIDGAPWLGIDDEAAAAGAARHMLELGHRRFMVIEFAPIEGAGASPAPASDDSGAVTQARRRGYLDEIGAAGIDRRSVTRVAASSYDRDGATDLIARALARPEVAPTAVLAMSDELALATIAAAARVGMAVPEDLSVVGFDDVPAARAAALTTVHQPHAEKGRRAVELLLERDRRQAGGVMLPTELVVRTSTAAP